MRPNVARALRSEEMVGLITRLYNAWMSIPEPARKAIQGALVSYQFSLQNILVALYAGYTVLADTTHQPVTFDGYLHFVSQTWFSTAMGLFSATYRARQGYKDAISSRDALVPEKVQPTDVKP
jgi:hypothetical protein